MNYVQHFLSMNRDRLGLDRFGLGERMSCVVLTPRFRASSHVVFLVLAEGNPDPVLVAKVPRLQGSGASLEREARGLRAVQAARPGGFDSIPRVVAFETFGGRPVLVETALCGRPMDPPLVRRRLDDCAAALVAWLTDVQRPHRPTRETDADWFERLVERPLREFADVFPLCVQERRWLDRTWELVAPLRGIDLPLVTEHGDLSHPNVMLLGCGGVGVVDWELADPYGLPTCDLFFFLAYAAFSLSKARSNRRHVPAFHAAFFGDKAWARRYVRDYALQLRLPRDALTPLFVLCWVRYMAGLLRRLGQKGYSPSPIEWDTAVWLRENRYYALWRHTLEHLDEIDWCDVPQTSCLTAESISTSRSRTES